MMNLETQIKQIALETVLPEIEFYLKTILDNERLLDLSEAAAMFGVSENTLRTYMKRAHDPLPSGSIGDRVKLKKSEVWEWIKRNRKGSVKVV